MFEEQIKIRDSEIAHAEWIPDGCWAADQHVAATESFSFTTFEELKTPEHKIIMLWNKRDIPAD